MNTWSIHLVTGLLRNATQVIFGIWLAFGFPKKVVWITWHIRNISNWHCRKISLSKKLWLLHRQHDSAYSDLFNCMWCTGAILRRTISRFTPRIFAPKLSEGYIWENSWLEGSYYCTRSSQILNIFDLTCMSWGKHCEISLVAAFCLFKSTQLENY